MVPELLFDVETHQKHLHSHTLRGTASVPGCGPMQLPLLHGHALWWTCNSDALLGPKAPPAAEQGQMLVLMVTNPRQAASSEPGQVSKGHPQGTESARLLNAKASTRYKASTTIY